MEAPNPENRADVQKNSLSTYSKEIADRNARVGIVVKQIPLSSSIQYCMSL